MSFYRSDGKLTKIIKWNSSSNHIQQLKRLEEVFIFSKGFKPHTASEVDVDIAYLTASNNICIKKLVYLYLTLASYCNDDIFVMAMNSASNDLKDPNPIVRSFTLCSIGKVSITPSNSDFIFNAILHGLQDISSNVRCNAINSIIQIYQKQPINNSHQFNDGISLSLLLDKVIVTINHDPDPSVVVRSLECLATCKYDHQLVHQVLVSLLDKVMLLDYYLTLVLLHCASTSIIEDKLHLEEKFRILNKVEPLRQVSTNFSLTVKACSLMLKLSSGLKNIHKDILVEITSSLFGLLMVSNKAARYFILCNLLSILKCHPNFLKENFVSHLNFFILLDDDPSHILVTKISILKFCITSETANLVFNNVRPYFHKHKYPEVVKKSFSLLEILSKFMSEICINVLCCSMYSETSVVVECAIITYYNLTITQSQVPFLSLCFTKALLASYNHLKHEEPRACFLQIICNVKDKQHAKDISKILKKEISQFSESTLCHQSCILHFTLFIFLQWRQLFKFHIKELFLKLFQTSEQSFVHEQAKLYYKLLKEDKVILKKLVVTSFQSHSLPKQKKNIKIKLKFDDVSIASVVI